MLSRAGVLAQRRVGLRSRLLLALGAAAWLACSAEPVGREVSALACSDNRDNDGDGRNDCADPDCLAHEQCTKAPPQGGGGPDAGGGGTAGGSGGSGGTGGSSGTGSSGTGGRPAPVDAGGEDEDASVIEPPDAGIDECEGSCGPLQACVDGACRDTVANGSYLVRLVSVGVPFRNGITRCFDDFCDDPVPSPPFGLCTCPPDPFVRLTRVRGSDATAIGETPWLNDEHMPDFSGSPFMVDLEPGDALRFSVLDRDLGQDVTLMYSCEVDAPLPPSGRIGCSAEVFDLDPEFAIEAELEKQP